MLLLQRLLGLCYTCNPLLLGDYVRRCRCGRGVVRRDAFRKWTVMVLGAPWRCTHSMWQVAPRKRQGPVPRYGKKDGRWCLRFISTIRIPFDTLYLYVLVHCASIIAIFSKISLQHAVRKLRWQVCYSDIANPHPGYIVTCES